MFGEKPMYGQAEVVVDHKSRITLPSLTKAENGDELLLLKSANGLKVVREDVFDKYITSLQERYEEEINPEKYLALENKVLELCSNIVKSCVCDAQRRITTSGALMPNHKYLVVGCRDSIFIQDLEEQKSLQLSAK